VAIAAELRIPAPILSHRIHQDELHKTLSRQLRGVVVALVCAAKAFTGVGDAGEGQQGWHTSVSGIYFRRSGCLAPSAIQCAIKYLSTCKLIRIVCEITTTSTMDVRQME